MTDVEKKLCNAVASFVYGADGIQELVETYWGIFWKLEWDEFLSPLAIQMRLLINPIAENEMADRAVGATTFGVESSLRYKLGLLLPPCVLVPQVTTETDTPITTIDPTAVISPV